MTSFIILVNSASSVIWLIPSSDTSLTGSFSSSNDLVNTSLACLPEILELSTKSIKPFNIFGVKNNSSIVFSILFKWPKIILFIQLAALCGLAPRDTVSSK